MTFETCVFLLLRFVLAASFQNVGENGCPAINGIDIKPITCGVPAVVRNMRACLCWRTP